MYKKFLHLKIPFKILGGGRRVYTQRRLICILQKIDGAFEWHAWFVLVKADKQLKVSSFLTIAIFMLFTLCSLFLNAPRTLVYCTVADYLSKLISCDGYMAACTRIHGHGQNEYKAKCTWTRGHMHIVRRPGAPRIYGQLPSSANGTIEFWRESICLT